MEIFFHLNASPRKTYKSAIFSNVPAILVLGWRNIHNDSWVYQSGTKNSCFEKNELRRKCEATQDAAKERLDEMYTI